MSEMLKPLFSWSNDNIMDVNAFDWYNQYRQSSQHPNGVHLQRGD